MANVQESRDYLKKVLGWEAFCKSHKLLATHLENLLNETESNPVEIAYRDNCKGLVFEYNLKFNILTDDCTLLLDEYTNEDNEWVYVISTEKQIDCMSSLTTNYFVSKDLDKIKTYYDLFFTFGKNLLDK